MIDTITLTAYGAIVLGFVFIPGPATLLTVTRAMSSGAKVGIATGTGIAAGDVVHTVMAIVGISAIIAASATLFSIIKYIGAAYLVYLGIRAILERAPATFVARGAPISAGIAFRQAILAEVFNPKTALFFLAFLPQFVRPENGSVMLQLTILGLVFVLLGLVSTAVFAMCAGVLGISTAAWAGLSTGTLAQAPDHPFPGTSAACDNLIAQQTALGSHNYPKAEVEPYVVADPTNPSHLVASFQQDRWNDGGASGQITDVSKDGGLTWTLASTQPAFTICQGATPSSTSFSPIAMSTSRTWAFAPWSM